MALKELEARYATKRMKDYKLADGEGLYLLVRASGSKLWRFIYRAGQLPSRSKPGPFIRDLRWTSAYPRLSSGFPTGGGARMRSLPE
jgi:hypothetical protein